MQRFLWVAMLAAMFALCACDDDDDKGGGPGPLAITPTFPADGTQYVDYTLPLESTGGEGVGRLWSIVQGALPAGLALDVSISAQTQISGLPLVYGSFDFTVQVEDAAGNSATRDITLVFAQAAALEITTTSLPTGSSGQPYYAAIHATGGSNAGYTWSLVQGTLPGDLVLSPSGTPGTVLSGSDSGTTGIPGELLNVQVVDSVGNYAYAQFTYASLPPPPPQPVYILTDALPNALAGGSYSFDIQSQGGAAPYTWTVTNGALPPGLSLSNTTSSMPTLSGTAGTPGTYNFTLQLSAPSAGTHSRDLTLVIDYPYSFPVTARYLYVCEASLDMSSTVLANLRAELTGAVQSLSDADEFDIIVYNSALPNGRLTLWGSLMPGTSANIATAVNWINGAAFNPAGYVLGTMYDAWEFSYQYPNVEKAVYMYHSTGTSAANILADITTWSAQDPNREIYAVAFAPGSTAANFGQNVAALMGGTYIAI